MREEKVTRPFGPAHFVLMEALLLSTLGAFGALLYFHLNTPPAKKINHFTGFLPPSDIPDLRQVSTPKKLTIRIITPAGARGTDFDAQVYQKIFPGSVVIYVDQNSPQTHPSAARRYDINFFVERLISPDLFPSTYVWLMVNQEMLRTKEEPVHIVDTFVCKTRYAEKLIRRAYPLKKVVYTGHTSQDLGGSSDRKKDYSLAVHFAGKSWLKGTLSLIKAWIKLDPKATLVVTCREYCLDSRGLEEYLSYYFLPTEEGEVYQTSNTKIIVKRYMPVEELTDLQARAGIWICPSEVEVFGHYINEGRSAGAAVVTTDFPPMNELINDHTGFLVKLSPGTSMTREGNLPGSQRVFPKSKDIRKTLERVFRTSSGELEKIGRRARAEYEKDQTFLVGSLEKLVQNFSPHRKETPH